MGTTWLEALPADHIRVIVNVLVRGRKSTTELQSLLNNNRGGGSTSRSAEELLMEIMTSFTESLSVLSASTRTYGRGDDDHQFSGSGTTTATGCGGGGEVFKAEEHSHCGNRSSEDSGESRKRPGLKDRRGCYKRRKNSESWATVSPSHDDGQAWRKYGQKEILNAAYPRAYFRCTRKYDQGCQATKQVQQFQDTPKMYKITYIGNHTCTNNTVRGHPQMMTMTAASDPPARNPHAPPSRPSSSSESGSTKKEHHASSSATIPFLSMKAGEECKQEGTTLSDVTDNNVNDTSDVWREYFKDNDIRVFPATTEDVVSNMPYCLDIDINFENEFNFDEVVFP